MLRDASISELTVDRVIPLGISSRKDSYHQLIGRRRARSWWIHGSEGTVMLSVHHVGITVSDLERSVGFYHDLIGLRFVVPPTPWFEGNDLARGLGVRPPVALRVALFEVGDG